MHGSAAALDMVLNNTGCYMETMAVAIETLRRDAIMCHFPLRTVPRHVHTDVPPALGLVK